MDKLKIFFRNLSEHLQNSPGSIDIIVTSGTSVLSERTDEWVSCGISNLSEVYNVLQDIIDIFKKHEPAASLKELPVDDLFASLQDLSYHSALFGIYFFAIEKSFEEEIIKDETSTKKRHESFDLKSAIQECHMWKTDTSKCINLVESIELEANKAYAAFDVVFLQNIENYPQALSCLYDLQYALLSLQAVFTVLKKNWWQ